MLRRMLKSAAWLAAVGSFAPVVADGGVLEEYVKGKDASFRHEIVEEANVVGVRVVKVRMTSQTWRGHEWQHWLTVFVPPQLGEHGKGVLVIEGGSNKDKAPDHNHEAAVTLGMSAVTLKAPVALLLQVPNQPLFGGLKEDDLIAHTFVQYLDGGDADWPLLLPMVKSATAAMDALQELAGAGKLKSLGGQNPGLDKFVVAGASKRGWTTWLTAAVDPRVCALAPSVIDVLNLREQMAQQKKTYGDFSSKLRPYTERDIFKRLDTPRGRELARIVDPFEYRDRIVQPKLMLLGSNDPYWTVDSSRLYYSQLKGPKALYYLPNAGHKLGLGVLPTLNNFLVSVLEGKPFPELLHKAEEGALQVSWKKPALPVVWRADSANRDFREVEWRFESLPECDQTTVKLTAPEKGWAACFVSITFPGLREGDPPFALSTPIHVLPETFPH